MIRPPQSLFELLGVSKSATDQEIFSAFAEAAVAHGGPDRVPLAVERAFVLLRDPGFRKNYGALWDACARGERVRVMPEERAGFLLVCREGGFTADECHDAPGTFALDFIR